MERTEKTTFQVTGPRSSIMWTKGVRRTAQNRSRKRLSAKCAASLFAISILFPLLAHGNEPFMTQRVYYRTAQIDGLKIFYREAGPKDAPTILLLHGLPSSSRMFESLFARLSDRYHLVAPDYPGFGHSDWPDPKEFAYTFDHFAEIMDH